MARRKRKPQGPSLSFESEKIEAEAKVNFAPPSFHGSKPLAPSNLNPISQDNPEVLREADSPDIVRSKDLKAIAARGDQLRRLGKALPLCWLPGDPATFKDTNG